MSGIELIGGLTLLDAVAGGGALLSATGSLMSGDAQNEAAKAEAAQLEKAAQQTRAVSERAAEAKRKQADLVLSRQQAVAAASGGTSTDTTVVDLMAETAEEGEIQAATTQWEGFEKAETMNYQAAIKRAAGQQAKKASYVAAGGSLMSGLSSWGKYKKPGGGASLPSYWTYNGAGVY